MFLFGTQIRHLLGPSRSTRYLQVFHELLTDTERKKANKLLAILSLMVPILETDSAPFRAFIENICKHARAPEIKKNCKEKKFNIPWLRFVTGRAMALSDHDYDREEAEAAQDRFRFVQGHLTGCRTGNGGKLSSRWFDGLNWPCLVALHFLCDILSSRHVQLS